MAFGINLDCVEGSDYFRALYQLSLMTKLAKLGLGWENPAVRKSEDYAMKPAVGMWSPRLRAASDRISDHMRASSNRVAVWSREVSSRTRDISTREFPVRRSHRKPVDPLITLAIVTLGIPVLLLTVLIASNDAIVPGAFSNVVTFLVIGAFLVGAFLEVKRLADQPSDSDRS
jgi:hypothetical protein